jgi:hypothetical protein
VSDYRSMDVERIKSSTKITGREPGRGEVVFTLAGGSECLGHLTLVEDDIKSLLVVTDGKPRFQ